LNPVTCIGTCAASVRLFVGEVMNARLRRGFAVMGLILMAASLSGCIVEGPGRPGGGWCYWHPGACR
jgi:hypothetical protein